MDKDAILAEISAQINLLNGISITPELVVAIDSHIKAMENQLNERLIHIPTRFVIEDFVPKTRNATKVDDGIWDNLSFSKNWWNQKSAYEEISYEKYNKGYGFFFKTGEVTFDLGVCEDAEGVDWYYRIIEDKIKSFKITGASVEIKLRAFLHLSKLLAAISQQGNRITNTFVNSPASGSHYNRMSLDMTEAFSPAELAEINRNYNYTLFK
ncbi:MAG: hypothetical protein JNM24_03890 [Bdellovibrionaceae bacterium]|nr:hypothetical protein [Pseudobdellovibrionaceae bacterium]